MHILFLTDNFPPETNAPASRTFEHAREWVAAGHKVTIITCAPNFPKGEVFEGYRNKLWQSETHDGIRVIRVWSYITRNEGFIKRILDYMSFMVTAFFAGLFVRKVDLVIGTSPQFFTALAAWALGGVKRRPYVFELRDIWPESIRAVGAMKESRVLDLLEKLELFLYRRATAVVAVTNAFRANLISRGIDGAKISVTRNGVDLSLFQPMPRDAELAADLGLTDKFVVGYVGTHGMAHALGTVLETADRMRDDDDVRFVLLGDGAEKPGLKARAAEMGLQNIQFLDSVPRSEVPRYWSLLNTSLIHLRRTDLFKTVIPSKLFECMSMGLPVLHGVDGESAEIVRDTGVGVVFPSEDAAALEAEIRRLKDDVDFRNQLTENGPKAALQFDRKRLAMQMLDTLIPLVTPSVPGAKGASMKEEHS